MRSRVRGFALACILVCLCATGALASTVGVSPTRLQIGASGGSADLTLANAGTESVSYSVRAFRWREDPTGAPVLEPTDDLIVYPQRLTLAPNEKRAIRVGYPGNLVPLEGEYRILATETASSSNAPGTSLVLHVRSRLSIPVFVAPTVAKTSVSAGEASIDPKGVTFSLTATGTAHLVASSVTVRVLDDAGKAIASSDLPAWYLLPNEPRVYTYALAPDACARVRSVRVDATFETGPPLHVGLDPKRSC